MKAAQHAWTASLASILYLLLAVPQAGAFTWPWQASYGWPRSSSQAVVPLDRPSVEEWINGRPLRDGEGFRFAVMGDQRALADGEWQMLLERMAERADSTGGIAFVIDTGDIVQDGSHSDQFARLRGILSLGPPAPYLVSAGNHEVHDNVPGPARGNTAHFLSGIDPALRAERLYYRKDIGPVRLLFLDTNDLVYGDDGTGLGLRSPPPGSRAEGQMKWLEEELSAPPGPGQTTIVVMHHPFVTSSAKHREQALDLWSYRGSGGRTLPDILADGKVDLVLTGHTHTYERFRIRRSDGQGMVVVNFSGRPRDSILWFGSSAREARDLRGREEAALSEAGWTDLDRWEIRQEDAMLGGGSNQYGEFTVGADGALTMEVIFLDPEKAGAAGSRRAVRIR